MSYIKKVNGLDVPMTDEEISQRQAEEATFLEEKTIPTVKEVNETLENAFLSVLPKHLGQTYLTPEIISEVISAKLQVTESNRLGMYPLSIAIIQGLKLPAEMEADREALIQLFMQGVG